MTVSDERLLTVEQVAQACGCSPRTIRRAISDRGLRASQVADRGGWRIRPEDLEAWLDERANRPRSTPDRPAAPVAPAGHGRPRSRRGEPVSGALKVDAHMGRDAA